MNTLKELIKTIKDWYEKKIPDKRLKNDTEGRDWMLDVLKYQDTLKLEDLRKFIDRESLNSQYVGRYKVKDIKSRKGISALKVEISALYSFNKCFVQRYKGRMHFYRDDLSQKGKRNMRCVAQGMALLLNFKENLDKAG
jgi:hypothetical protein